MKIERKQPIVPADEVVITLTLQEAAKLAEVLGHNVDIPKIVGRNASEVNQVRKFTDKLFYQLSKVKCFRSCADWSLND